MSSNEFTLVANARADVGKGASRRLRRLQDEIPAIIYGADKDPVMISIAHKDIMHATESEAFFSSILELDVEGKKESVVIKALQRHPAKPRIMHADFLRVSADQAITVRVPLHFVNEEKCVGVKIGGGSISHLINDLEVSCLPGNLPEYIEVDLLKLDIGETIHISDLHLPEGVSSVDLSHGEDADHGVVTVNKKVVAEEEEEAAAPASDNAEGEDKSED